MIDFKNLNSLVINGQSVKTLSIDGHIVWMKQTDWKGLKFIALQDNSTITMSKTGTPPSVQLEASTDYGETWTPFVPGETTITLPHIGDMVFIKAPSGEYNERTSTIEGSDYLSFSGEGQVVASGNINTIITEDGNVGTLATRCLAQLFRGMSSLIDASSLELPTMNLGQDCYVSMFGYCSNLRNGPYLPATTLASGCYGYVFNNCSSLRMAGLAYTGNFSTTYFQNWMNGVPSIKGILNYRGSDSTTGVSAIPNGWSADNSSNHISLSTRGGGVFKEHKGGGWSYPDEWLRNVGGIKVLSIEADTPWASNIFAEMSSLKVLEFTDDNVTVRGYAGQADNASLEQVIFRHSVDSLKAAWNFSSCTSLKLVDMRNVTKVPTINTNSFNEIPSNCKIVVPDNLYDQFVVAQYWSNISDRIVKVSEYPYEPVSVEPYGDGKFEIWGEIPYMMISESGGVRELKVHSNVINNPNALYKIYGLKRIEFHGGDVTIGGYAAIADNPDLEEVVFKHDVSSLMGKWCFSSNAKAKVYDLRNVTKVPQLRENAFNAIPSTCKIVVPDALFDSFYNNGQWEYVRNNLIRASEY